MVPRSAGYSCAFEDDEGICSSPNTARTWPMTSGTPGHLVMPDGSLISSPDHAFLTACAPHVLAAHLRAMGLVEQL